MKCPYQIIVTHIPERTSGYVKHFAEDRTEFGECINSRCPFYYTFANKEHCRRTESEDKNDLD